MIHELPHPKPATVQPVPSVVDTLRRVLKRAEKGEIQGICLVWIADDHGSGWMSVGRNVVSFSMAGAAGSMLHCLQNDVMVRSEESAT